MKLAIKRMADVERAQDKLGDHSKALGFGAPAAATELSSLALASIGGKGGTASSKGATPVPSQEQ